MSEIKMNIIIEEKDAITKEIQQYVKAKLPEIINEIYFQNPAAIDKIIRDVVKSQIRSCAVEVLQGKELRNEIMNKVTKNLLGEE